MNQLIAPTHTVVDNIPLGRRISEIMQEKGPAYTISAMAKRLDISRETLRLMLKGEREIYYYELDKIAHDLKVTVERILQSDISEKRKQFKEIISSNNGIEFGASLTDEFLQCALGYTERFESLNQKGIYLNRLRDYSKRDEFWLQALPIARTILERYGEPESLLRIVSNLSLMYSVRKDKKTLLELISEINDYLHTSPQIAGVICFSLGFIEEREGNLDKGLLSFYQYLDYMERTKNPIQIAKACTNLAFYEYRMKNYQKSIDLYHRILEIVQESKEALYKCNFYQGFARTLIRLNRFDQALELLDTAEKILESLPEKSDASYIAEEQIYFLLAITKKEPQYAEILVKGEAYNVNIRKIACKFLIDLYAEAGNVEEKEKYEIIIRQRYTAIDMMLYEKDHDVQYLLTLVDLVVLTNWR